MPLTDKEHRSRNYLKEQKPYVYEKVLRFAEKIRRGESIAIIQMQYNYQCNLTCEHCCVKRLQGKNPNRKMTTGDVASLAKQADAMGLARFVITGGEPLTFLDLDEIVAAINPQKFYINVDTNGWLLDEDKARHLKSIGVDRIQLSLDSMDAKAHDAFRGRKGSHERALKAVDACLATGLDLYIQTVVTKDRLRSDEFIDFVRFFNEKNIGVFVSFAKPVGAWEGQYDQCIDSDDLVFFQKLEKEHRVYSHLTPGYGIDMGCIAVKGMFSVTQYGDVLPCPYMHISLGNIFEEPLSHIVQRGLGYKYFGEKIDICTIAQDRRFFKNYLETKIYGQSLPVNCSEVFDIDDMTTDPFHKNLHST
ncbi:radical SAM protein [Desulfovibrio sp. OttesenSCG-928-M16]|nr:radical SAM protein [Desulfovibrio sp. OttesenSCG-928-M16]